MAIARVNSTNSGGIGAAPYITATGLNCTAGNFIVVGVGWEDAVNLTGVTDTAGNTYTIKTTYTRAGACKVALAYAFNITGHATNKFTATFSASSSYVNIGAIQYSGILTTDPFDQENGSNGNAASASAGSVTTTQADELLITIAENFTGDPWGTGTGWTEVMDGVGSVMQMQERIVSATGSYTGTASLPGTGDWAMAIATFKASGGAVAATSRPIFQGRALRFYRGR